MKKIWIIAVALMMGTTVAFAQTDEPKNEFSVAWGGLSNSQVLNTFVDVFAAAFESIVDKGTKWDDVADFGTISAEYFHHVSPVVSLGAIGVYNMHNRDLQKDGKVIGSNKRSFITLLPAVKFNWLRKDSWGMYSKLGAGASLLVSKEKTDATPSSEAIDNTKCSVLFNFQVSALGVEFGRSLRGFCEAGFGEQGVFLVGLRYRF